MNNLQILFPYLRIFASLSGEENPRIWCFIDKIIIFSNMSKLSIGVYGQMLTSKSLTFLIIGPQILTLTLLPHNVSNILYLHKS